ncbi:UNVERIFIED_CONTAM: hypothetical protein HDU68_002584 [Siphonaria sp. JEL0065]|nr:hypothetical protein HDU68_002584 [Siphonaria sp. JEL0065]
MLFWLFGIALALLAASGYIYTSRRILYHAFMNTQLASELSQTPFNDPPMLELVVARAMAATKLDALNIDNSSNRSDFDANARAALADAWNLKVGVLRRLVLDAVVADVSRRMKIVDALISVVDNQSADSKMHSLATDAIQLPSIVVITSAFPFAGSSALLKYFKSNPQKFLVPSLADIKNIVPIDDSKAKKVHDHASFSPQALPPVKPIFTRLLDSFASASEKRDALNQSDFRLDESAYLNCTFHALTSFGLLPLPSLTASTSTSTPHQKQRTVELLKLLLQIHVSKLSAKEQKPEFIILEGHEHSLYLDTLHKVFGPLLKIVLVDHHQSDKQQDSDARALIESKLEFQIKTVESLVLGGTAILEDSKRGKVDKVRDDEKVRVDGLVRDFGLEDIVFRVDGGPIVLDSLMRGKKVGEGARGVVDVVGDRIVAWLEESKHDQ